MIIIKRDFWNVFETSGDPLAYLIYKKTQVLDVSDFQNKTDEIQKQNIIKQDFR